MPDSMNGCSKKHFAMACWLIGVVLTVAASVSVAIGASYGRMATEAALDTQRLSDDLSPRVRITEATLSGIDARLAAMQRTLDRVEKKLEN